MKKNQTKTSVKWEINHWEKVDCIDDAQLSAFCQLFVASSFACACSILECVSTTFICHRKCFGYFFFLSVACSWTISLCCSFFFRFFVNLFLFNCIHISLCRWFHLIFSLSFLDLIFFFSFHSLIAARVCFSALVRSCIDDISYFHVICFHCGRRKCKRIYVFSSLMSFSSWRTIESMLRLPHFDLVIIFACFWRIYSFFAFFVLSHVPRMSKWNEKKISFWQCSTKSETEKW